MSELSRTAGRPGSVARRRDEPLRRWLALALACAVLAALWAGPLPRLASVSFTAHMALHLALVMFAAPLVAVGLRRAGLLRHVHLGAGWALAFSAIEMMTVWSWHAPAMHAAAALRPGAFALQQASFLGAGLIVWLPGLAESGRPAAVAGVAAMVASFTHMTMLGVILALAPHLIYDPAICGGAFGLDALADQQVGGAMMAAFGGLGYLTGAVFFLSRLLAVSG